MKQLPADKQERARTNLAELKNVKFDIWVGARQAAAQGHDERLARRAHSMDAALMFKGYNEPVSIQAPPADQVGELPKSTTN